MPKKIIKNLEETGIIDAIGDAISIQDTDFKILYQNKRHKDMIGDKSGEYCYQAIHRRDHVCKDCKLAMTFKYGRIYRFEHSRNTDKGIIYAEITTSPLKDSKGTILAGIEVVRDITKRKQMEKKLKETIKDAKDEKTKAEAILDAIGDPISIQDTDFKILYQNLRHKDIVGDKTGKYCYKAYQNRDNVCEGCHLAMSFKDGKIHTVERSRTTENGTMYSENTASPLRDSTGKIIAGIEVVRDISERKMADEAIQKARNELEKRVKERTIELEESNTALKVLLKQRENDQKEFENNILSNIKHLIWPYIEKIKNNRAMSEELVYINLIESNLKEIVSPFSSKLSFRYLDFTPREILLANLIRDGKQDKEITEILNISLETVKSHRQNIRKKLGIYGERFNLRTKLLSLSK